MTRIACSTYYSLLSVSHAFRSSIRLARSSFSSLFLTAHTPHRQPHARKCRKKATHNPTHVFFAIPLPLPTHADCPTSTLWAIGLRCQPAS
ncbi:hypothetical protein LJC68_10595, partial [Bacteroidales bacterium OttesenSCG-928-B11]|nr:hypothetical protein [Bacteroidales bacterium OttesenSCG-928-B11]